MMTQWTVKSKYNPIAVASKRETNREDWKVDVIAQPG